MENEIQSIINSIPALVWTLSPESKIEFVNQHFLQYIAHSEANHVQRWVDAIHPDDIASGLEVWRLSRATGVGFEVNQRLRRGSDGQYRWLQIRSNPVCGEDGKVLRWIVTATDIHDERVATLRMKQVEKFAASLSHVLTKSEVMDIAVREIAEIAGAPRFSLSERTEDGKFIETVFTRGLREELVGGWIKMPYNADLPLAIAYREAKILSYSLNEVEGRFPYVAQLMRKAGDGSIAVIPLVVEENVTGVITMGMERPTSFDEGEYRFFSILAQHLGLALERARLYELEKSARRRAETERKRFYNILMDLPARIAILKGPEHILELANPSYLNSLGESEHILGKPWAEARPSVTQQPVFDMINGVYRTGEPVFTTESEVKETLASGEVVTRYLTGAILPWKNENGSIEGVISFSIDATEQVKARREYDLSQTRLKLALESARLGLWEFRYADLSVWRSGETNRIFGLEPEIELFREDALMSRVHPDDQAFVWTQVPSALSGIDENRLEYRVLRPDGEVVWVMDQWRIYRDSLGNPERIVGVVLDITHIKKDEEALKLAKEAAEAANRAKSAFIANISHEFRTPLTAILGFAELLGRDIPVERRAQFVDGIQRNGSTLINLINELIDLSKVEAGHIDIEPCIFNPQAVLDDVIEMFRPEIGKKSLDVSLTFAPDVLSVMVSDPFRIKQILTNLIGNAVKFSDNGSIKISVQNGSQPNSSCKKMLMIVVEDEGVGIQSEQRENLFKPFAQGDQSVRRRFGGSGLGLFISRKMARALGGDVVLDEKKRERGASFQFTFEDISADLKGWSEQENRKAKSSTKESSAQISLKGRRVLVVEDTEDIRALLCTFLSTMGMDVEPAVDGCEGLMKMKESQFDVILMDLHMPRMDGFTANELARKEGVLTPIIAVTARAESEDRARCLSMGFDGYLTKPIGLGELEMTLRRLFRSSQDQDQTQISGREFVGPSSRRDGVR